MTSQIFSDFPSFFSPPGGRGGVFLGVSVTTCFSECTDVNNTHTTEEDPSNVGTMVENFREQFGRRREEAGITGITRGSSPTLNFSVLPDHLQSPRCKKKEKKQHFPMKSSVSLATRWKDQSVNWFYFRFVVGDVVPDVSIIFCFYNHNLNLWSSGAETHQWRSGIVPHPEEEPGKVLKVLKVPGLEETRLRRLTEPEQEVSTFWVKHQVCSGSGPEPFWRNKRIKVEKHERWEEQSLNLNLNPSLITGKIVNFIGSSEDRPVGLIRPGFCSDGHVFFPIKTYNRLIFEPV